MVHALHAILRSRDAGALLESHPRHPPEGVTNLPPSTTHSICNQPEKQKVFLKYPWQAGFVPCSARLQAGMCLNQKSCVQGRPYSISKSTGSISCRRRKWTFSVLLEVPEGRHNVAPHACPERSEGGSDRKIGR